MEQRFDFIKRTKDLRKAEQYVKEQISQNQPIREILNEARFALREGQVPNDNYRRFIESLNIEAYFRDEPSRIVFYIPNIPWLYEEFGITLSDGVSKRANSGIQKLLQEVDTIATNKGLRRVKVSGKEGGQTLRLVVNYTYDKSLYDVS